MRQTILGSGGAIGRELARELTHFTDEIRLVSRHPQKVNDGDELFRADLTDRIQVQHAVAGSQVVYLTAGLRYHIKIWQKTWPQILQNVIEASVQNQCKLVFFDNVYMLGGDQVRHMTESSPLSPVSKKGEVRTQLNRTILEQVEKGRLNAIIARSADFYGPPGTNSLLTELVYKNLKKGKKAQWLCTAKKIHSFTYTLDAAKGTAILGNTPEAFNQIWHLPTEAHALTGEQWIRLFAREMGSPSKYQVFPIWLMKLAGLFSPLLKELPEMCYQYDRDYFFDSSKFCRHFNFQPTTSQEGVKQTVLALSAKS
ncbi:MAG: NAD-dependent epimerase/dehydratase family protein [Chitinophagaceae bacterium]